MAVVTDVTIERLMKRKLIRMVPFIEKGLTPVGYDVHASDVTVVREDGQARVIDPVDGDFVVPPGAQFLVLTREYLVLHHSLAASIHSQVGLVSMGMSHISTTIDPGWSGRLLLSMVNLTSRAIKVPADHAIATIIFHTTTAPAKRPNNRPKHRSDLIDQLLERDQRKLRALGVDVADRLKDEVDERYRDEAAGSMLGLWDREGRQQVWRWLGAAALFAFGAAMLFGGEAVFELAGPMFPSLGYEHFFPVQISTALAAMGAAYVVWTRKPTE